MAKKKKNKGPSQDPFEHGFWGRLSSSFKNLCNSSFQTMFGQMRQAYDGDGLIPTGKIQADAQRGRHDGLTLTVEVYMNYGGLVGVRSIEEDLKVSVYGRDKRELWAETEQLFPGKAQELVSQAIAGFPIPFDKEKFDAAAHKTLYQDIQSYAPFKNQPTLESALATTKKDLLAEASAVALKEVSAIYEKRLLEVPKKAAGEKLELANCTVSLHVVPDFKVEMVTTLTFQHPKVNPFASKKVIDGLIELFQQDPTLCTDHIRTRVLKLAVSQGRSIAKKPPLFILPRPDEILPEYRSRGNYGSREKGVSGSCSLLESIMNTSGYTISSIDGVNYLLNKGSTLPAKKSIPYVEEKSAYNIERAKELPATLHEFRLFCQQANELYTSFSNKKDFSIPPIHFSFSGKHIDLAMAGNYVLPLTDIWKGADGKTVKAKLSLVFKHLVGLEEEKAEALKRQVALLNRLKLDFVTFKVLSFVVRQGRTWNTEVGSSLYDILPDKRTGARKYLDALCKTEVTLDGVTAPLLRASWESGRHGDFQIYQASHDWQTEAFKLAKPAETMPPENLSARALKEEISVVNGLELDPTAFAILAYVAEAGQAWVSGVNNALAGKTLTSTTSTRAYLEEFCHLRITLNGKTAPILGSRWVENSRNDFKLYFTNHVWHKDTFQYAKPVPFTAEDLDRMSTEGKQKFVMDALASAKNKEARWSAFSLLEKMPKPFVLGFAQSDEGAEFFNSMRGEDASYARFFLESLPGGKRIAKSIFDAKEKET